jgi:RNA polymerase sigma factor (sigma-70 family)
MNSILRHLRRTAGPGLSDAQLLESFLVRRDEAAFGTLLRRHGPMVLAVCRRVLGNAHDAEDAFQATFLVLVRKAASLRSRDLLGNWLYGVAYRTALKARTMSGKRRAKERQAAERLRPEAPADGPPAELLARLDAELSRLPEKYRLPLVLCDLEGKSRKEVARLLALPEGTLSWRLAHAKKLLARRLFHPGAVLSVGGVATLLSRDGVSAGVPPALVNTTARAAFQVLTGEPLTSGGISAQVTILTEGVLKAMLLSKINRFVAFAFAVLIGVGAIGLTYRPAAAQSGPGRPANTPPSARVMDELEELRLEVAALRKGLESTRARVQVLENEVQTLKANRPAAAANTVGQADWNRLFIANPALINGNWQLPVNNLPAAIDLGFPVHTQNLIIDVPANLTLPATQAPANKLTPKQAADPLADAEAALKKLRQNTSDKQAADALERAAKELRERAKHQPVQPAQGPTGVQRPTPGKK